MSSPAGGRLGLPAPVLVGTLLLAAVTLVSLAMTVGYPFIQDDWYLLEGFTFSGANGWSIARDSFLPGDDSLFYRPFGYTYLLGLQRVFGLNELGFHAVHLLLLFATSLVVVAIAYQLTRDRVVAWATGTLVAGAVVVKLVPSLWMAGSYDIAGALLYSLSLLAFMRRRIAISAVLFLAALLFKEASVTLVLIVGAYHLLFRSPAGGATLRLKALGRELWPFVLIVGLWIIPKLQNVSPFSLAPDDPYRVEISGSTLLANLHAYLAWSGRVLLPSAGLGDDIEAPADFAWPELLGAVAALAALALAAVALDRRRRSSRARGPAPLGRREIAFLAWWWLAGLLPVLFLANHPYAYYLAYSLPAFVILAVGLFSTLLSSVARDARLVAGAIAAAVAVVLVVNVVQAYALERSVRRTPVQALYKQGLRPFALGQIVQRVERGLARNAPVLPRGAVLELRYVDPAAIQWSSAPRVWYRDPTIEVVDGTFPAEEGPSGNPEKVVVIRPGVERPLEVEIVQGEGGVGVTCPRRIGHVASRDRGGREQWPTAA